MSNEPCKALEVSSRSRGGRGSGRLGWEEGEESVEEGGLGDGDVALARDVDAGDGLPPLQVEVAVVINSGLVPWVGVGAELDGGGGELWGRGRGAARGRGGWSAAYSDIPRRRRHGEGEWWLGAGAGTQ
jgi:hypothetical protein